jgi:CRP-like cAMP-binding protein
MPNVHLFPTHDFDFKSHSLFDGLPHEDLEYINSVMNIKKIKKGTTLFIEGSFPSGVHYLISGTVKKFKSDKLGKEQIIYICNTGELLGYRSLLSESYYSDSAMALEDITVGFISKQEFIALLENSMVLSKRLLKNLCHEFAVLENSILSIAHKSVRERLALNLLILRDKYKNKFQKDELIEITLTREDLSNMVGTAVETLVRLLRDFKEEKLIETEGRKIRILNPEKLLVIANLN